MDNIITILYGLQAILQKIPALETSKSKVRRIEPTRTPWSYAYVPEHL